MKDLKFILVDDNNDFRQAMKDLLETEFSSNVIAEAATGREFLDLTEHYKADIIIMDLYMPDMTGLEATKPFLWKYPFSKVMAITMHTDKAYLQQLLEIGFKGCIFKDNIVRDIRTAIEAIMNGKYFFPEGIKLK